MNGHHDGAASVPFNISQTQDEELTPKEKKPRVGPQLR